LALAPLIAHQLDVSTEQAKQRGVALLLDAPIPPEKKLELAPALFQAVTTGQPRNSLRAAFAQHRDEFGGDQRAAYDQLAQRSDATVIDAVTSGFHDAFLLSGLLAALAALVIGSRRVWRTAAAAGAAALALAAPAAYAVIDHRVSPRPVAILDPCQPRAPPAAGGVAGLIQSGALQTLDVLACRLHTTREQLVLALVGDEQARAALVARGLDLSSALSLLGLGGEGGP
jgi:hypothetical protein